MQPTPYIDEQTGERFYNVQQAAQIVGTISPVTLYNWAKHGSTPFGFDLDVQREPITHHRRSTQTPRTFRETRMLIPEARVFALREILRDNPRRPGPISREDMEWLKVDARRFRSPLSHL